MPGPGFASENETRGAVGSADAAALMFSLEAQIQQLYNQIAGLNREDYIATPAGVVMVQITNPGDSGYATGDLIPKPSGFDDGQGRIPRKNGVGAALIFGEELPPSAGAPSNYDVLHTRVQGLEEMLGSLRDAAPDRIETSAPTPGPAATVTGGGGGGFGNLPLRTVHYGGASYLVNEELAARMAQEDFYFGSLSATEFASFTRDLYMFNNLSAYEAEQITLSLRTEDRLDRDQIIRVEEAQRNRDFELDLFERELGFRERRAVADDAFREKQLALESRGQQIRAIADMMAVQIEAGTLVYQEAAVNLSRISEAMAVRREERDFLARFALTQDRLVERDGETTGRVPLSGPLSRALGVDERELEVPITRVNPQAEEARVLAASSFESPIPGINAAVAQGAQQLRGIGALP